MVIVLKPIIIVPERMVNQTEQSRDPVEHMIKHVDIFDCYNLTLTHSKQTS